MKLYVFTLLTTITLCCRPKKDDNVSVTETLKDLKASHSPSDTNWKAALPGLNFGVSVKEYQAVGRYMIQDIGTNNYFVKPIFNSESKLCKIELAGLSYNASYSEAKLRNDQKNLVEFFEIANGPSKVLLPDLKLNQVKPGQTSWTHYWSRSTKQIKVGILQDGNGKTYSVVGWVYDQVLMDSTKKKDSISSKPEKKSKSRSKRRSKHKNRNAD